MTDIIPPLVFEWSGEAMIPKQPRLADRYYVIGQKYVLEERLERSSASHRAYFAEINDLWMSLSDDQMEEWPSAAALRKAALIRSGFRDEKSIVLSSKAEAQRVAAFVKPQDEYAVVSVSGSTVVVLTAKSQSTRAMGRDEFNRSKEAVLNAIAEMIGVNRHEPHDPPPEAPTMDREPEGSGEGLGAPDTAGSAQVASSDPLGWAVSRNLDVEFWKRGEDALRSAWDDWRTTPEFGVLKRDHSAIALKLRDAIVEKIAELRNVAAEP